MQVLNIASYKFVRLDGLPQRRKHLRALCSRLDLKGTILLSPEGINLFVAGEETSHQRARHRSSWRSVA